MKELSLLAPGSSVRDGPEARVDVAVLGAGVAGLTAAHDLSRLGLSVVVVDRSHRCGGTHRSWNIGPYTFDSGSIFFEPNHPLFAIFDGVKERCHTIQRRQGRVAPDGKVRHYPFDLREVGTWPFRSQLRGAVDLAAQRLLSRDPKDAEAFCLSRLGRSAYQASGLSYYIERFHQEHPANIDVLFCERRMQFVLKDSHLSALGKKALRVLAGRRAPDKPRLPMLVRPRGGFDEIYGRAREQLAASGVAFMMNAPIGSIERVDDRIRIETPAGTVNASHVIGALPMDVLHRLIFGAGTGLEGIDLMTLFVSVSRISGFDGNVLFNFHPKGRWKRVTIYSRIYGQALGREYFSVEITQRTGEAKDATAAFEAFCRDVADLDVFAEDLSLEGFDVVENAYPLYSKGCGPVVSDAIARLSAFGIVPVGRQGRFAYLPVSAQVIAHTRAHLREAGFDIAAAAATPAGGQ